MEIRANTVKTNLSDTENLKVKLENKDEDLKELKKQIKLKVIRLQIANTLQWLF